MNPPNDDDLDLPLELTPLSDEEKEAMEVVHKMDPRLQHYILQSKSEDEEFDQTLGASEERPTGTWVDVIAELKTPDVEVDGLKIITRAGNIVTGRALVDKLNDIRTDDNVLGLKAGRPIGSTLHESVWEIQGDAQTLNTYFPHQHIDGSNVIVGVVDNGCDFVHPNFCTENGTRLLFLWDQDDAKTPRSPKDYPYGKEWTRDDINAALTTPDPYKHLRYDSKLAKGAHGTHVLDIAAGNGRGTGTPGVAPGADLVFVHLAPLRLNVEGNPAEGQEEFSQGRETLSNTVRLIEAVRYIFDKAGDRPAVVNLSLANNDGPHDGSTYNERYFENILNEQAGRAIVIAAGNAYENKIHYSGKVIKTQSATIDWQLLYPCAGMRWIQIWYPEQAEFEVELKIGNVSLKRIKRGDWDWFRGPTGKPLIRVYHRHQDSQNHENNIEIGIDNSNGQIKNVQVVLHYTDGDDSAVVFHAWIQRDVCPREYDYAEYASCFKVGGDSEYTLGSISNGKSPIVVGSYYAGDPACPISEFSSAGPTRATNAPLKPDLSAPGESIWAAYSRNKKIRYSNSGTSMAAPHVTGLIALIMQVAKEQNKNLSIQETRNILLNTARKNPPPSGNSDFRYGAGRIDCSAAIAALSGNVVPTPVLSPVPISSETHRIAVPSLQSTEYPLKPQSMYGGVAAFSRELADVATQTNVRLHFALEVEPVSLEGKREIHTEDRPFSDVENYVDVENYLDLLKSSTRELHSLQQDREWPVFASETSRVDSVAHNIWFWQPDHLFVDRNETLVTDGQTVEVVEIPDTYLRMGTESPDHMNQVLLAELDYIDAHIPEPQVDVDALLAAESPPSALKNLIQKIKEILRAAVAPQFKTTASSLSSFQKNWQSALNELTKQTVLKGHDIFSSLLPAWGDIGRWLKVFKNKLPKGILKLPEYLQELTRWLFAWFHKHVQYIQNKFKISDKLKEQFIKQTLDTVRKGGPQMIAKVLWQTQNLSKEIQTEVQSTTQRLQISTTSRLSSGRRNHLETCLEAAKYTVHEIAWDMFMFDKMAWAAGLILRPLAAVSPDPFVELGMVAVAMGALGLIAALGADALRDRPDDIGLYPGIGPMALKTLRTLE